MISSKQKNMSSLEKDKTYANEYPKKINKHTKSKTPPKCILNQRVLDRL